MVSFFSKKSDNSDDRSSSRHDKVNVTKDGVISLNLENKDVKAELKKKISQLKELEEQLVGQ